MWQQNISECIKLSHCELQIANEAEVEMTWGKLVKKGVDTENSRNVPSEASAPLNSRNSVTVTANDTIWRASEGKKNEIWVQHYAALFINKVT